MQPFMYFLFCLFWLSVFAMSNALWVFRKALYRIKVLLSLVFCLFIVNSAFTDTQLFLWTDSRSQITGSGNRTADYGGDAHYSCSVADPTGEHFPHKQRPCIENENVTQLKASKLKHCGQTGYHNNKDLRNVQLPQT